MSIWSIEIKQIEQLYESFKGQLPDLEKELERLIRADDENMILLYSRRSLEVIITDLCESELKRPRKTEPLKGIIDKLHKEEKVPSHIITSMLGLNELSTYGAHPKDFDPEQVRPVLNNLAIIVKWYLKYKETGTDKKVKPTEEIKHEIKSTGDVKKDITISRKRLAGILGGLIGIIASVFAVLYFSNIIGSRKQITESDKSIAVLPFKLLSDEPGKQYLADGMMEAINLHLQKFKDLRVLDITSVEQYRETIKTTNIIGQELEVTYLLEGTFQKSGDNVKLNVRLVKANEKGQTWANEYDRYWKDIFSVQSEVAQSIAGELHTIITPKEKELIEKVPTTNLVAYDQYMKANSYQKDYQKTRNISSYQNAVTFYKAAIEIDSTFAKAYTGFASTYYKRYYNENYFKVNFLDTCLILANKALSFDNQLDEAYYLKGLYYRQNGQVEEALDYFDKALLINPNSFSAYLEKGDILTYVVHDYVKGIDNYHKALNLINGEERLGIIGNLGFAYQDCGFIEKAKYYYQEALTLDSNKASYYFNLTWLEFSLGNYEDALQMANKANEIDSTYLMELMFYSVPKGHNEEAYIKAKKLVQYYKKSGVLNLLQSHRVGYAFWQAGKFEEAKYYLNQQIKYSEESIKINRDILNPKAAQYDLAATYAFLGDKIKAYQHLDEFNKRNFYQLWWVNLAKHDPLFTSIHNEERFQKILQNMEAKYQAEHERVKKWLEEQGML